MEVLAKGSGCRVQHPGEVGREAARVTSGVARPAGGIAFLGGSLAAEAEAAARSIAAECPGLPFLVVSGAWVIGPTGELEDQSAASILVWSGKSATLVVADGDSPVRIGEELVHALGNAGGARGAGAIFLAIDPERFDPAMLEPLQGLATAASIFGVGTSGSSGPIAVQPDGTLQRGPAAAIVFRGLTAPVIEVSPAVRLLSPLTAITTTRGSLVLRVGDQRALDTLTAAGETVEGEPLLLAALSEEPEEPEAARPAFFLRPVRGVDPTRRGVFVSDEARPGVRMAIAARDPAAAREDLEAVTRHLRRSAAGAAPRFAIFVGCTGRGARLYGNYDVDGRVLRSAFGEVPLVGVSGAFQIAPHAGKPRLHLFSGVVALFTAPS